jgi:two-component system, cell cycle sensor histidine kinase and response regulator CckA
MSSLFRELHRQPSVDHTQSWHRAEPDATEEEAALWEHQVAWSATQKYPIEPQESETRNSAILDASPDAVITIDRDNRVLDFNQAAHKILGWPSPRSVRGPWPQLVLAPIDDNDIHHVRPDSTIEVSGLKVGRRIEVMAQRADGSQFPAEITVRPIRLATRTVYAVWMRDITEQRRLENQLWRSQKMEAVGRLAGGVAHDFNNLLTVITGYSDLVVASLSESDPRRKNVEEILKAADRAASLTRQLLAFSRRQVLAPQPLDLNGVVLNLDKMLRRLIGEDIEVSNLLSTDLWTVKADPGQIEQVLVNLAVNARDAMPEGGKLTIETANAIVDAQTGRQYEPPMPAGNYVMLAVSDDGCGMDQETQNLIFEPFFTTKEEGKGTGLGLSTVYGIIKQSGGFIWVQSEPEHGTSFKIYLPRIQHNEEIHSSAPSHKRPPAKGTETLLVVEDEHAVGELVRGVLESAGYTVLLASRGEEAIQVASARRNAIDLLLTDVVMPQMGGREVAKAVEKIDPKIKIVYMSGYAEKVIVHQGILEPGAVLIQKPFTPDTLIRKIREVLDKPRGQKPKI